MDAGGFIAAAARMDVSPSHVSRQVARLEDRLGVKLLARSTRSVRLTDEGADYHARVADFAAGIEEANQAAAGARTELAGRIRVAAAGPFAEQRVAPVLARFARANPGVQIEMDFNSRMINLVEEGFDFAVRYGVPAESGLVARRLATRTMVCAASPAYLRQHGTPQHPADLRNHACLITNNDRWRFSDPETGKPIEVRVRGTCRCACVEPWMLLFRGSGIESLARSAVGPRQSPAFAPVPMWRRQLRFCII